MTAQPENVSDSNDRHIPVMSTTPAESLELCSHRPGRKPRDAAWSVQRTARAFERWLDERSDNWPGELYGLGFRAMLALKSMDQPTIPDVIVRENARDLANFIRAYAAHIDNYEPPDPPGWEGGFADNH